MKPIVFFRLHRKTAFIPWHEISVDQTKKWGFKAVVFSFKTCPDMTVTWNSQDWDRMTKIV